LSQRLQRKAHQIKTEKDEPKIEGSFAQHLEPGRNCAERSAENDEERSDPGQLQRNQPCRGRRSNVGSKQDAEAGVECHGASIHKRHSQRGNGTAGLNDSGRNSTQHHCPPATFGETAQPFLERLTANRLELATERL